MSAMSRFFTNHATRNACALLLQACLLAAASPVAAKEQAEHTAAMGAASTVAASAASAKFEQVPGVYRQQIGSLQVTALLDGVVWLPPGDLKGVDATQVTTMLQQAHVPQKAAGVQTAVNVYLVQRADRLMLVDAGSGTCLGNDVGKLAGNMRQAGVQPALVTDVLLTHAHPDHICGLVDAKGQMAYPKATVWISEPEAAYWLSADVKASAPEGMRPFFDMVENALQPYVKAGQLRRVQKGDSLPPGVRMVDSEGHTPGHVSWLIEGDADNGAQPDKPAALLVWGDVVHYHAVQFAQPDAWFAYDEKPEVAVATRRQLLRQTAEQGWLVAGAHLPFPGLGHVAEAGHAWRWVPVEFGPVGGQ